MRLSCYAGAPSRPVAVTLWTHLTLCTGHVSRYRPADDDKRSTAAASTPLRAFSDSNFSLLYRNSSFSIFASRAPASATRCCASALARIL